MNLPMSQDERASFGAVCKAGWFLVTTAIYFAVNGGNLTTATVKDAAKAADLVGKQLDEFLKDIN